MATGRDPRRPLARHVGETRSPEPGVEKLNGKWCCRCRQWLSPDAFRPNPNYTSGLDSWCRSCHADAVREWRAKNPDYVERYNAERRAEYRAEHPLHERPCVVCGKPFGARPDALACSTECRRQRKNEQRAQRQVATRSS